MHSTGAVGERGSGDGEFNRPFAMALVPGLGLVVREYHNGGRLQLFATADGIRHGGHVYFENNVDDGSGACRALAQGCVLMSGKEKTT